MCGYSYFDHSRIVNLKNNTLAIVISLYALALLAAMVVASGYCKQFFMLDEEPALCGYFINQPSLGSDALLFAVFVLVPIWLYMWYISRHKKRS